MTEGAKTKRRQRTALHEAGHAVIALHFREFKVLRVKVNQSPGHTLVETRAHPARLHEQILRRSIQVYMAGGFADATLARNEKAILGTGADYPEICRMLEALAPGDEAGQRAIQWTLMADTLHLIGSYRAAIQAVADELLARGEITGGRVRRIMKAHPRGPSPSPDRIAAAVEQERVRSLKPGEEWSPPR
jgi:ATP-dependent Zn protease